MLRHVLRPAEPRDLPRVVSLIRALAEYEKLSPPDDAAAGRLGRDAFGADRRVELLVAEPEGESQRGGVELLGYAAFFPMYSTFLARPTLYLEDLFVRPEARGNGIGEAMLRRLAKVALERDCGRFDWTVLDWNVDAQRFYRRVGAEVMSSWWTCRVEGPALRALAQ